MKFVVAFLFVLVSVGSVLAARPNPRPDPLTDCCIQGVPICARLSQELAIQDLGCEISCRSSGRPGSLGCDYSRQIPACRCNNA